MCIGYAPRVPRRLVGRQVVAEQHRHIPLQGGSCDRRSADHLVWFVRRRTHVRFCTQSYRVCGYIKAIALENALFGFDVTQEPEWNGSMHSSSPPAASMNFQTFCRFRRCQGLARVEAV